MTQMGDLSDAIALELCHGKILEPMSSKPYLRVTRQIVAQVFGLK
jgi:hypothetical protein